MKKKIVVWANDENEKKILVGLELKAEDNKIAIHTFPEEIATEVFYNEMMDKWRNDEEVAFPEGHSTQEKPLSITESILPDNIKVTRSDIINRAATEWQFIVLSTKLYEMYKSELAEKKEKVAEMTSFDNAMWSEMKEFWNKVQSQVFDNNLLRDHANQLKEHTNSIFDKLKKLRTALDKEFDDLSKRNKGVFNTKLVEIDEKINKGLGLNFKKVKASKPGGGNKVYADGNNPVQRIQRRYDGLMSAIGKMQNSINKDERDINYENRKINTTDGQLEQQIRQAKLKMIEGRISSKKAKLADMNKTKGELEARMAKEKKRAEVNKAKEAAKAKIATQIEQKSANISNEEKTKLEKAAEDLTANKKPKQAKQQTPVAPAAAAPVTEVVNEKKEVIEDKAEAVADKVEDKVDELKDKAETAADTIEEKLEAVQDKAEDVMEVVADKLEEAGSGLMGAVGGLMDAAKEMIEDAVDSVSAVGSVAKDQITESLTGDNDDIVPSANKARESKVSELLDAKADDVDAPSEKSSGGLLGAAAGLPEKKNKLKANDKQTRGHAFDSGFVVYSALSPQSSVKLSNV